MEKMILTVIYNRKGQLSKNGTALIQVRAYLNGCSKYFGTGIKIAPDQWDKKHSKVKNNPNALRLNKQISDFLTKLEDIELTRRNAKKPFTLDILSEAITGNRPESFTQFMEMEIKADRTAAPATKVMQTTTFNALCEFRKSITFDELTFELMSDFERFLLGKKLHVNTVHKYFRHIRKFVNLAINKDYLELNKYPFRKFKLKSETTEREYLTPEELQAIENLTFTTENAHLEKIRDMFIFSCYCGLRFSDISALNKDNVHTIDGETWLILKMQKTSEPIRIPLYMLFAGRGVEILNRYTLPDRKYFFDDYTNQYVNRSLKDIASLAKVKKCVTFHTARHTQATYLLYKGVSITSVQKLLGHKKLQTTQIYSKVMDKTLLNELQTINFG